MPKFERTLRLVTGLAIAAYVAAPHTQDARLGSLTKQFGTTLVVSAETLRVAGVALPDIPVHRVEVRGKVQQIEVLAIEDPATLLLPSDQ